MAWYTCPPVVKRDWWLGQARLFLGEGVAGEAQGGYPAQVRGQPLVIEKLTNHPWACWTEGAKEGEVVSACRLPGSWASGRVQQVGGAQ